jgi:hypothetical protein
MNKMASILIMSVGVLVFLAGLLSYIKLPDATPSPSVENPNKPSDIDREMEHAGLMNQTEPEKRADPNDLSNSIAMALADGVLTTNEKNLIKQLAEQKGLDAEEILLEVESQLDRTSNHTAETQLIDQLKKNGDDFEKFVVQKFNRNYFTIKEWAGDKYVNGYYAPTTQHPDLLMELKLKNQTFEFAVECKWRKNLQKEGISFATPAQFSRYQEFEKQRGIPVFIALGIGGTGFNPEELSVIPLKNLKSPRITNGLISKYQKGIEKDFYYDTNRLVLK